jgi:hypothetical protein
LTPKDGVLWPLRGFKTVSKELEQRLTDLEAQFVEQGAQIQQILQVICQFVQKENEPRKPIGFK